MHTLLNATPAPGFDDPLAMLQACHGRITAQCTTLRKLQAHLPSHGNDEQALQAARAILHYFDTAGQFHHQDEEQDLFPALRACGDATVKQHLERLLAEHQGLEACWHALRPQLATIAERHGDALDDAVVEPFIAGYAAHIAFENETLLPLARALLDTTTLQRIGRSMAARRGVVT